MLVETGFPGNDWERHLHTGSLLKSALMNIFENTRKVRLRGERADQLQLIPWRAMKLKHSFRAITCWVAREVLELCHITVTELVLSGENVNLCKVIPKGNFQEETPIWAISSQHLATKGMSVSVLKGTQVSHYSINFNILNNKNATQLKKFPKVTLTKWRTRQLHVFLSPQRHWVNNNT